MIAWAALFLAGLFEIGWAYGLKVSAQQGGWLVHALTIAGMIASFSLLAFSLKTIPIGTAYAIWTSIGVVGTAILGMVLFAEPATALRIGCIVLIIIGGIGLKISAHS